MSPIEAVAWQGDHTPHKILAIRFQAFGDIVGCLPALKGLRVRAPDSRLDLLTRHDVRQIPQSIRLFDRIHTIRGGRNQMVQMASAFLLAPRLALERYDLVIDLQNNAVSRLLRKASLCRSWSAFDRFSPSPHGERVKQTIQAAWATNIELDFDIELLPPAPGGELLPPEFQGCELVALNPAGFYPTRNWPLENYIAFAELWRERRNTNARFIVMGVDRVADKARRLEQALSGRLLNLVGQTSQPEAIGLLQRCSLILSEDSGLMHMAWCTGRPTVALFGSTRSVWSRPLGQHAVYLDSSDLPCGECMQETCFHGDVRCLSRYSPEEVFELASALVDRITGASGSVTGEIR